MALAAAGIGAASASAATPKLGSRTLRNGMTGPDVRALQRDLTKAGFDTTASGRFGAQTALEVKRFERFYRLHPDGIASHHVIATLHSVMSLDANAVDADISGGSGLGVTTKVKTRKAKRSHSRSKVTNDPTSTLKDSPILAPVVQDGGSAHLGERTLKQGMSGHDVRVLQSYLTLDGYPTTVDGDFGPSTESSVLAWEAANNVKANGVVTYAQSRVLRLDVAKATDAASPKTADPSSPVATSPVSRATLNSNGTVTAPSDAPAVVQEMISAANSINDKPYVYAGGHGKWNDVGYDCSGSVSFVLHAAGLLSSSEDSGEFESYGSPGKGRWVTLYTNSGHVWIVIAGLAFDTAHWGPTTPGGTGPRWLSPANTLANLNDGTGGYVVRHPTGF